MQAHTREKLKQVPLLVPAVRLARRLRQAAHQRWHRRPAVNRRKIAAYLAAHPVRKLQIGSGPTELPGWLNTDFEWLSADRIFLDATRPFPLPDQSFRYVFSEHMIEHIDYAQGRAMLAECFRILQPGGRIRISTPNLRQLLKLFAEPLAPGDRHYLEQSVARYFPEPRVVNPCYLLNQFLHTWGHQFVYDPATLRHALETAGFREVAEFAPGESHDPALRHVESHARQIGEEFNRFESMVLEAVRP